MEKLIDHEFEITFLTNLGNTYSFTHTVELEVPAYFDRVEECFGFHKFYEVDETEVENAIIYYEENLTDEELLNICNEQDCIEWANDNEKAIQIL